MLVVVGENILLAGVIEVVMATVSLEAVVGLVTIVVERISLVVVIIIESLTVGIVVLIDDVDCWWTPY